MTGARAQSRRPLFSLAALAEGGALLVAVALCFGLGHRAAGAWLARTAALEGARAPAAEAVRSLALRANLTFAAGVLILAVARAASLRRARDPLPVPFLIPAAVFACLLGLLLHHATVETFRRGGELVVATPSAAGFAQGFLLGAFAAAAILVAPLDLAALAGRLRVPIAAAIGALFFALALFGSGPAGSGARVNLGPLQPIEVIKVLVVVFLAGYLGPRAAKLRWQRRRLAGLRWPRPALLLPAVVALLFIFAGLFVVGDLGPVLVLALVFLALFSLVTGSSGWVAVGAAMIAALLAVASTWPGLFAVGHVATRIHMWHDPWWNGLPHGNQLGESLWAIAAGGLTGQGLGHAATPLPPAAKTDLALALLAEQLGAGGVLSYIALVGAVAAAGIYVAARSRTPERALLAAGASLLVVIQWLVIHGGTFGHLPLTGIVVPFLSTGRTSMIAFLALVGLVARLAEDSRVRASSGALDELHRGTRAVGWVAAAALLAGGVSTVHATLVAGERRSAMGIATRLRDGTLRHRQNPRLMALARKIRRGTIADRAGRPLAKTEAAGGPREAPLGPALGTLLGTSPSRVLLPPWALERAFDHRLRGYGERSGGPTFRDLGGESDAPLPWPDLRAFAPLLTLSAEDRQHRVELIDADVAARSVRVSIDAALQRRVASILAARVAKRGRGAAAAAVLDADSGQVLARAQVPDYDPGDPRWQRQLLAGDPDFVRRFTGAYGAWPDKTGLQGMYQAGSVAKLFTALAAVRSGIPVRGRGCEARAAVHFACDQRDEKGPFYVRSGWGRPIHDFHRDALHGDLDLTRAIAVSCNVFFAQLGLELGPGPLVALRDAGAIIGYTGARPFEPGAPGSRRLASTSYGQGAMVTNVMQAARLVAAIGSGGRYRRCPPTMELDASCPEVSLIDDPAALAPILAGMRQVMTRGTGRSLKVPPGIRVYGKTGTADARGFAGEEPFGIGRGEEAPPHSWFVALLEPASNPECAPEAAGRIALAVVVPRGGGGAVAAGPIAMEIAGALEELGYLGEVAGGGR